MPKVNVDLEKCTGCFACVDICPMEVFSRGNNKVKVENEKGCVGCRACETQCPVNCIEISDN